MTKVKRESRKQEIKVRHEPRKEVIIHEISVYRTPEDMIRVLTTGMPVGTLGLVLKWVNGALLEFTALPFTGIITAEIVRGRLHWDHVSVAPMPQFQPTVSLEGRIIADVMNVSENETFRAIGRFLQDEILSHLE